MASRKSVLVVSAEERAVIQDMRAHTRQVENDRRREREGRRRRYFDEMHRVDMALLLGQHRLEYDEFIQIAKAIGHVTSMLRRID